MTIYTKTEKTLAEKAGLPLHLVRQLTEDGKAQMRTLVHLAVFLTNEAKQGRADAAAGLGKTLGQQFTYRSVKTWQNYVSAAVCIVDKAAPIIAAELATAEDPGAAVVPIMVRILAELAQYRYTASMDDLARWGKGQVSLADKAASDKAASEKLAAEQAANAVKKAEAEAAEQAARKAEAEAAKVTEAEAAKVAEAEAAKMLAEKAAAAKVAEAEAAKAEAEKPAEAAKPAEKPADMALVTIMRRADGSLYMVDAGATRAELVHAGLLLQAALDAPTELVQPIIGDVRTPALV